MQTCRFAERGVAAFTIAVAWWALALTVAPVSGQTCGGWLTGLGQGLDGIDGSVYAATAWDPDGAGPKGQLLVAAGAFEIAGHIRAKNVAVWSGSQWQALGSGLDGSVSALVIFDGRLTAAGSFVSAGGESVNCIAQWYDDQWRALKEGVSGPGSVYISDLLVRGAELIVCGRFSFAGGLPARNVVRFSGNAWSPMGAGIAARGYYGGVLALAEFQGQVYAAGTLFADTSGRYISDLAAWNGTSWTHRGNIVNTYEYDPKRVNALEVFGDRLIVAGEFAEAGGVPVDNIASWDGTAWRALDFGLDDDVYDLGIFNGELRAPNTMRC